MISKTFRTFFKIDIRAQYVNLRKFTTPFSLTKKGTQPPNKYLESILTGNKKWVEQKKLEDPIFFDKLAQPQNPKYLYFGCSDSRVPANQILGKGPGQVFIHRNVGNLVPGNDINAMSVLEYAVTHLQVTDIIVTGHYDCGAVRAATKRQDLGLLENWLRQIRDIYRLHREYLDLIHDEEQRHMTLVELNVVEQCLNLYKTGVVQRTRNAHRESLKKANPGAKIDQDELVPRIHGLVFNPADGILKHLPVDFAKRVGALIISIVSSLNRKNDVVYYCSSSSRNMLIS